MVAPPTPASGLERIVFATSRAAEFLDRRALQAQTGQTADQFGDVVIKELVDNALDAAETAGARPRIEISIESTGDGQVITVADNGPGIPADVVERILDFDVLVSDKAAYRSPTRGLQGNAWKTMLGIPYALDVTDPVVIESQGVRHEIAVTSDPGGNVVVHHETPKSRRRVGTRVQVPLPDDLEPDVQWWARAFAVVNPHAEIRFRARIQQGNESRSAGACFYKPTAVNGWRKPVPTDKTSPHWYDAAALKRLVFAYIAATRNGGADLPLGEFIRTFLGLTSTVKAKAVAASVPGVMRLSDFQSDPDRLDGLLAAMRDHAKAPKPHRLGSVGESHFAACFSKWYGVKRCWHKCVRTEHRALPWVLEVAVAETEEPGEVFYAANYSPTFADPLAGFPIAGEDSRTTGVESFLRQCDAFPDDDNEYRRAAVVHVICPGLEFTDKGKTRIGVPQ